VDWHERLDDAEMMWAEMPPLAAVLACEDLLRASEAAIVAGDFEQVRSLLAVALAASRTIREGHPAWRILDNVGLLLSGFLALQLCD